MKFPLLRIFHSIPFALGGIFLLPAVLPAATISGVNILTSYGFTGGALTPGTYSFNLWDDTTGALLGADNGDQSDLTIIYSTVTGGGTTSLAYDAAADKFTASHAFPSSAATVNPGTRIENRIEFRFASHLMITALNVDFTSLNTAGATWEFSQLGYLAPDYTPFSPEPVIPDYLTALAQPARDGVTPSQGWFQLASTATVTNVGTLLTGAGTNGTKENLTATSGNGFLDYLDVGLLTGTPVGGFVWTTILEDTRGTSNPGSGLTSTMITFAPSGSITAVPEVPAVVPALALLGTYARRRRMPVPGRDPLPPFPGLLPQ